MSELSVVIPIYKVEAFLPRCLKSVLQQQGCDMEIILVDDCSPDSCGRICDEYAVKDDRIRVIHHKQNRGLSAARNSGIKVSTGTFITFVDSDDCIEPDTYCRNLNLLFSANADVVEYPVEKQHRRKIERYAPSDVGIREETFRMWFTRRGFIHCYAWNKIYRRELFDTIEFPEGRYFEDLFTIPYVLQKTNKIIASSYGCYKYTDADSNSITKTLSLQKQQDLFEAYIRLFNEAQSCGEFSRNELYVCFIEIIDRTIIYKQLGGSLKIPEYKLRFKDLLQKQSMIHRLKSLLILTIGISATVKLFSAIHGNIN